MREFAVAVVPVGRMDRAEIEAALVRASRVIRQPIELTDALRVPPASSDAERGQHRAGELVAILRGEAAGLPAGRSIGDARAGAHPRRKPDAYIFVTDVDLFTARSDGVLAAIVSARQAAVVSVRRLREAFYRRRADPVRQRTRLVKEVLRVHGRLHGAGECPDPKCALAPSRGVPDVDVKDERYCRTCEQRLFEGRVRI